MDQIHDDEKATSKYRRSSDIGYGEDPLPVAPKQGPGMGYEGALDLEIDHVAEKKLVRKLDLHIVPMVMLLYLLSFLDRVNIGNAKLYGLQKDLGLTGNQYLVAVSLLFVTYVTFEVPSNLVLKKFTPSRYISLIATSWGIIATLTGLVHSYGSLIACRLLLGLVESGLYPGMAVYLTLFYTRRELALRIGYLFVSAALAGAFGGLLAYGISYLDGKAGLRAWRWIFIIEGMPTFVVGVVTWFLLADSPQSAKYLSEEEKLLMIKRRNRQIGQTASAQEFHWYDVGKAFLDWKIIVFCLAQFGVDTMLYGFSTFLPTIIKGLGKWSTAQAQALTVPCYALGAITYMAVSYISDKRQIRGLYCVIFGSISVIGYGLLISSSSSGVHYFGCCLVACGLYVAVGLPEAWVPNNSPRYGKRTTAMGLQLTIGNSSGVMAPFLYPDTDAPRYVKGHAVSLSMVGFAICIYGFMWYWLNKLNQDRKEGKEDFKVAGLTEERVAELGDESPRFFYIT